MAGINSASVSNVEDRMMVVSTLVVGPFSDDAAFVMHEIGEQAVFMRGELHRRAIDDHAHGRPQPVHLGVLAGGARRRVGYGPEGYPGFMTDSVPGGIPGRWRHWAPLDNKHEVDYCLALAQAAGATLTPEDRIPRLYVDEKTREEVEQLLLRAGLQPRKPLIICHINSNNGQSKRWPIPYWATLIDRLIRQEGAQVVLTGAPGDMPQIDQVTHRMHEQAINLAGKTSLTQLAALLQRADLLISGDSGPLHMGVACGTPIIGIYGPTNPSLGGPVSPDATVLRSGIWCSPCYNARDTADCPFYTTQCMKNILPSQVFEIVQTKLVSNIIGQ